MWGPSHQEKRTDYKKDMHPMTLHLMFSVDNKREFHCRLITKESPTAGGTPQEEKGSNTRRAPNDLALSFVKMTKRGPP